MNGDLPRGRPIFVSPHADDAVLSCGGTIAALAAAGGRPLVATEILGLPGSTPESDVFVPLGIGSHADHLVCFAAAQSLADRNVRVLAWEDVPYVIHSPEGLQRRLSEASSVREGPTLAIDG